MTVGGNTRSLPDPFLVFATQNPIEQEGTYPLPEAQLDRFLFEVHVDYPSEQEEREIARRTTSGPLPEIEPVVSVDEIRDIGAFVPRIPVTDEAVELAVALARASRPRRALGPARGLRVRALRSWPARQPGARARRESPGRPARRTRRGRRGRGGPRASGAEASVGLELPRRGRRRARLGRRRGHCEERWNQVMVSPELESEIKGLMIEQLDLRGKTESDIEDEAPLFGAGLGLDSLDALQLAMAIEERFGVAVPEGEERATGVRIGQRDRSLRGGATRGDLSGLGPTRRERVAVTGLGLVSALGYGPCPPSRRSAEGAGFRRISLFLPAPSARGWSPRFAAWTSERWNPPRRRGVARAPTRWLCFRRVKRSGRRACSRAEGAWAWRSGARPAECTRPSSRSSPTRASRSIRAASRG